MADSNLFLSPYENFPTIQENKYWAIFKKKTTKNKQTKKKKKQKKKKKNNNKKTKQKNNKKQTFLFYHFITKMPLESPHRVDSNV